ncbi:MULTISPECIES: GNAT family N-acetyltransferase [unclassified Enterococcus]|uniref:GNAT family N-acetyltransferase n=1 Tax=unclassified Enterococcus TaxID=2608891 RepID=UPI0015559E42|nr:MULTISPECIES: GNAT family N-acetyltransferase [unclassified Enterococcus]MBS7576702.1 GNAT family N-acetyltransferase [Enterococcus sp. MMGLQ5-2]MBS7583811.1 GNAT family N-acetyltransferase [Enterococcus sp. MMGLQ5-1]NPD11672.1 GNAT family N-acetyltransferase [Enterococcus sp. MMGLQ5-1]NPD36539.1 GNAT family N-acetyltransferase [Enterococcus sp. MMGLQ5-2]
MKILSSRDTLSNIYFDGLKIRQKFFVKEQGIPPELEIDHLEAYCIHLVYYNDQDIACGVLRLYPDEKKRQIQIQRLAVLKAYRGQQIGKALILFAEHFAQNLDFQIIDLHAQLHAKIFYQKLGYQAYGEIFRDAGIPHIAMRKELK